MNAVFSLLNQLSQTAWDRVTGAEQPKLYIKPTRANSRDCWGAYTASRKVPTNTVVIQHACPSFVF